MSIPKPRFQIEFANRFIAVLEARIQELLAEVGGDEDERQRQLAVHRDLLESYQTNFQRILARTMH